MYLYKQMVNILPLSMVDGILAIAKCGQDSLSLNTYINTQMELKKLQFHTPDRAGKSKCHKIHVGIGNKLCPELQVHGTKMVEVSEDKYLGDIISSDGRNTKTIKQIIGKSMGIISDSMNLLDKVFLGEFYFTTAVYMFLNGILTNAESWYVLFKEDIHHIEDLDISLLKKMFNTKCTTEALYLELGCLDISTLLKARRLNYLHYLTTRKENSMLFKFVLASGTTPLKMTGQRKLERTWKTLVWKQTWQA